MDLKLLQHGNATPLDLHRPNFFTNYQALVGAWVLSFQEIRGRNSLAGDLLALMSCFDHQSIPREFLITYMENRGEIGHQHGEVAHDYSIEGRLEVALGVLQAFSLMTQGLEGNLYLHQLVQLIIRQWVSVEEQTHYFTAMALRSMSVNFPWPEYQNQALCAQYLPHAQAVLRNVKSTLSTEGIVEMTELQRYVAEYLLLCGLDREAGELLEQCIELFRTTSGVDDKRVSKSLLALSLSYRKQGRLEEARKMQIQAEGNSMELEGDDPLETFCDNLSRGAAKAKRFGNADGEFWPEQFLNHLITADTVQQVFDEANGSYDGALVAFTVNEAKKLFAITANIDSRPQLLLARIQWFKSTGITDGSLAAEIETMNSSGPTSVDNNSTSFADRLASLDPSGKLWRPAARAKFCDILWKAVAPVISTSRLNYNFKASTILPFAELAANIKGGAFSAVHKVAIYKGYYKDDVLPVSGALMLSVEEQRRY
jgi:hypothetical protein